MILPRSARGTVLVGAAALVARLAVVAWAGRRFPPAHDGVRYDALARRLAEGGGYMWQWPNGHVTAVAHYPVGYPALLAGAYRIFGESVVVAGCLNAALGVLAAIAAHRLLLLVASSRAAMVGGLAVALHPGLVLYTPGIMTEGPTAALVTLAAWLAAAHRARNSWWRLAGLGVALGVAGLVRPQSLLLAPVFGWLAARWKGTAACVLAAAIVCAPWVARNCAAVGRCTISTNAGWNLLIGAQSESGGWQSVEVPPACSNVYGEAETDTCFGREARATIRRAPLAWAAKIPGRLGSTFDYGGIGGYYLFLSNSDAFPWSDVVAAGGLETVVERAALLLALLGVARASGPRPLTRRLVVAIGVLFAVLIPAWVAVLALCAAMALLGARELAARPLTLLTFATLGATVLVHAAFFGAARYALVAVPLLTALAAAIAVEWRACSLP